MSSSEVFGSNISFFYCTFIIYLIIKPYSVVYMEIFKGVHHIIILVICKTSMIFPIGVMEFVLSIRCFAIILPIYIYKILEIIYKSYTKRSTGLSNICSITVLTC